LRLRLLLCGFFGFFCLYVGSRMHGQRREGERARSAGVRAGEMGRGVEVMEKEIGKERNEDCHCETSERRDRCVRALSETRDASGFSGDVCMWFRKYHLMPKPSSSFPPRRRIHQLGNSHPLSHPSSPPSLFLPPLPRRHLPHFAQPT
jgi:hypothetical protein